MADGTKWTPGRWAAVGSAGRLVESLLPDDRRATIAEARAVGFMTHDEARANALLIAAAPDLYAALAELVGRRERACREHGRSVDGTDGRYVRARAALARAIGEE